MELLQGSAQIKNEPISLLCLVKLSLLPKWLRPNPLIINIGHMKAASEASEHFPSSFSLMYF